MQTITTILFTALILGFLLLFLLPGHWWPRKPPRRASQPPPEAPGDSEETGTPEPRRYTGYLN
jgi:hypothetical protein